MATVKNSNGAEARLLAPTEMMMIPNKEKCEVHALVDMNFQSIHCLIKKKKTLIPLKLRINKGLQLQFFTDPSATERPNSIARQ